MILLVENRLTKITNTLVNYNYNLLWKNNLV